MACEKFRMKMTLFDNKVKEEIRKCARSVELPQEKNDLQKFIPHNANL